MSIYQSAFGEVKFSFLKSFQQKSNGYISLDPNSIICEGNLFKSVPHKQKKLAYCILTKNSFIIRELPCAEFYCSLSRSSHIEQIELNLPTLKKIRIEKVIGFTLIKNGIKLGKFFFCNQADNNIWFESLKEVCVFSNINDDFEIKCELGRGGSASVRKGINKETGERVAIKCFDKSAFRQEEIVFFTIKC